jgi:hypothetical protein
VPLKNMVNTFFQTGRNDILTEQRYMIKNYPWDFFLFSTLPPGAIILMYPLLWPGLAWAHAGVVHSNTDFSTDRYDTIV